MSALNKLPQDTRDEIAAGKPYIREDLLIIARAEAAGWTVSFDNDNWHNAAKFQKAKTTVWSTGRDWRRAEVGEYVVSKPSVFKTAHEALGFIGLVASNG